MSVSDSIKYLQSRAMILQSADEAKSDKHFIELKEVIEALLKELVFALWNIKSCLGYGCSLTFRQT